jgi:hypothetical protein
MTHEAPLIVSLPVECHKEILMPAQVAPAPPQVVDPNQARAVEAVFAAREKESQMVVGLLGLWTGTALLNDLAIETFSEPAGEIDPEEEKPKRKRR